MIPRNLAVVLLAATLVASGCSSSSSTSSSGMGAGASASVDAAVAVAMIEPTQGNTCRGTVTFTQKGSQVVVVADLTGLTAGKTHAMHVHEKGDCSAPDAMSAGAHYNPGNHPHALPPTEPRHAGDLGNVVADASGKAHHEITVDNLSVNGSNHPVSGLAVIVHAQPDDGGQPTGNAGGRIGCGVIKLK